MATKTISDTELLKLKKEVYKRVKRKPPIDLPQILGLNQPRRAGIETGLDIHGETEMLRSGLRKQDVASTIKRVWGPRTEVVGVEEKVIPDKPHITMIQTNAGRKVLKKEKPPEGRVGVIREGIASVFSNELGLRTASIGVGGLERRKAA